MSEKYSERHFYGTYKFGRKVEINCNIQYVDVKSYITVICKIIDVLIEVISSVVTSRLAVCYPSSGSSITADNIQMRITVLRECTILSLRAWRQSTSMPFRKIVNALNPPQQQKHNIIDDIQCGNTDATSTGTDYGLQVQFSNSGLEINNVGRSYFLIEHTGNNEDFVLGKSGDSTTHRECNFAETGNVLNDVDAISFGYATIDVKLFGYNVLRYVLGAYMD